MSNLHTVPLNDLSRWDEADKLNVSKGIQEVINSGQYNLMSSYETLFTKAGNNSRETVFEVQFLVVGRTYYSNNYFESQGVRGVGTWDLGWGFNVPTSNLINAFLDSSI